MSPQSRPFRIPKPAPRTAIVVDDHAIVREGLTAMLLRLGIDDIREADGGDAALVMLHDKRPDLIISDISMPGMDGIELIRRIRGLDADLPILVLSIHSEARYALRALRAGASGYINKDSIGRELETAIGRVCMGRRYVSAELAELLADRVVTENDGPPHARLTEREFQVLDLLLAGRTASDIAAELYLSTKTISTHKMAIYEKLGVQSAVALVRYAIRHEDAPSCPAVAGDTAFVKIRVIDTGCGMDDATKARIFEPYFTTKARDKGTGLGLATAAAIVAQSGGSLRVHSALGHGSTFTMYLPRQSSERVKPPLVPPAHSRGPGHDKHILAVDDSEPVRHLVQRALRADGYHVTLASGLEQVQALLTDDRPVDLLLTDVVMAGGSGMDVAGAVLGCWPAARVLYMSGNADHGNALPHGLKSGIAFLPKPFTPQMLSRRTAELLGGRAA